MHLELGLSFLILSIFIAYRWGTAYKNAQQGDTWTAPVKFTSREDAYTYGQAYVRPVSVLTNANCYSACDIFSSNMKDVVGATIFSEDPETGAGGANVVKHGTFFVQSAPSVFQTLPNGQDMSIGWRQLGKVGRRVKFSPQQSP